MIVLAKCKVGLFRLSLSNASSENDVIVLDIPRDYIEKRIYNMLLERWVYKLVLRHERKYFLSGVNCPTIFATELWRYSIQQNQESHIQ